ncbi:MAG: DUF6015 family protein [Thermoplasmata archaeon]|jgi:hypothetical protein
MLRVFMGNGIVRRDCFVRAIINYYRSRGIDIDRDSAYRVVDSVLAVFGFDLEIIENNLDNETRSLFYILEEAGMIRPRIEEVSISLSSSHSKYWRISYFTLDISAIENMCRNRAVKKYIEGEVYGNLPDSVWSR